MSGVVADPPLPPPPNDERPRRRSQPPPGDGKRGSRWKTVVQYVLGFALAAVGLFFGFVAYGVIHDHKSFQTSFGDALPIYPKSPEATVFGKQRIYVMLLGIDYNYDDKGMPFSKDARSDTIMVAGLDFPTKSMKLVSVLRDTAAPVAGRETKINEAYSLGGVKLADAAIGDFLGMPANAKGRHFDRYVVVNVNGVKEVVNAIGGIDVDVTENMDYDDNWGHLHIHFKKDRRYHMNGEQAQGYMRFRYDACSDPCRTKRQQQIIHIVLQKLKSDKFNDLLHIGQLIGVFNRNVRTNLTDTEKKSLAWAFHDANLADLAHADTIGYVGIRELASGDAVIADEAQKSALVAGLLGPYGNVTPAPASALQSVNRKTVHLVVQNGSGISGLATTVSTKLEKLGYVVDSVGNADSFQYDTTQIRPSSKVPFVGERVRADLGVAEAGDRAGDRCDAGAAQCRDGDRRARLYGGDGERRSDVLRRAGALAACGARAQGGADRARRRRSGLRRARAVAAVRRAVAPGGRDARCRRRRAVAAVARRAGRRPFRAPRLRRCAAAADRADVRRRPVPGRDAAAAADAARSRRPGDVLPDRPGRRTIPGADPRDRRGRHEIADHTLTHPNLDQLGEAAVRAELRDGAAALERIAPDPAEQRLFRPPHGRYTVATIRAAQAAGYDTILWSDDPGDWRSIGAAEIRDHVLRRATAPEIVLLHSGRPATVASLAEIVERYRRAGYTFVTVGTLLRRTSAEQLNRPARLPLE